MSMFVFLFYEHNPMGLPFFFLDTNAYQELAILGISYLVFPSAIFRKRR